MDRKIEKKKRSPFAIGAMVFAAVVIGLFLYNSIFLDTRSSASVDRSGLIIEEVAERPFQEFIDVQGTVLPIETMILDAIEGGVVQQVFRQSGEMVEQGDTLLTLANSTLQLSVMQQEAGLYDQINNVRNSRLNLEQNHLRLREELASSRTQLDLLEPRYRRDSLLYEQELISQQEFEQTRQQYRFQNMRYQLNYESFRKDSAQMQQQLVQLDQSEQRMWRSLEGVQQILDNLVVRAPMAGQLSTVELNPGQSIRQGDQIGQIDVLDGFRVRLLIDEFYLARITTGLPGRFEFGGQSHELRTAKLFPVIQEGQFQVDMEFTNGAPANLRRGQTVRVRLELGEAATALLVPRGGFYQQTGGNWIFRLDAEGERAVRQPIRLGRGNSDYYEVLDGLSSGDRVITSGYGPFSEKEVLRLE
ncbi:MAG: efflux RND transporter periplasmic adaptor subunit [Balneolaceae bacterium]